MAEVKISMNGRSYNIACDKGQEGRIVDLAHYVDQRIQMISKSGSAYNDTHLMVLASIIVADELFDARDKLEDQKSIISSEDRNLDQEDENAVVDVIEYLTKRINGIAERVQKAS